MNGNAKGNIMKRAMKKIAAVLIGASLVVGLLPSAALGVPAASSGSMGAFDQDGKGKTNVYVLAQNTSFRIVAQSDTPTAGDIEQGVWVQTVNAAQNSAFNGTSARWFSKKVEQNGEALSEADQAATLREWTEEGAPWYDEYNFGYNDPAFGHDTSQDKGDVFYMKAAQNLFDLGGTYQIWAEVTDGSGQVASNASDPIVFTNSRDYWAGPITWTAAGGSTWTWQAAGALYDEAGQKVNAADGKLLKGASLSAFKMAELTDAVQDVAAERKLDVDQAWTLNVADADGKRAFLGTLAVDLDLTEALGLEPGAELSSEELADLSLVWMNPYATGSSAVVELGSIASLARKDAATGHLFATFTYPEVQAGTSGFLGTFLLARPMGDDARSFTVTVKPTEGGTVSDTSMTRLEGSTPSFLLFEREGYRIKGVYLADGVTPAPAGVGALEGNRFTLAPLAADVQLVAAFERIPAAELPSEPDAQVEVRVQLVEPPAGTSVTVSGEGYTGTASNDRNPLVMTGVPAGAAPVMIFNVGGSYVADKVTVSMTAPDGSTTVLERWPNGSSLGLPTLVGDARIEVTFREDGTGGPGGNPGPSAEQYQVSAVADPVQAASVSASAQLVEKGGWVTFTTEAEPGWQLTGAAVMQGGSTASYAPADLSAGTLTVYNIQSAVSATFRYELIEREVSIPNRTQFEHVFSIDPGTSVVVDALHPATLTVVVEDGYELLPGNLWIEDAAGNRSPLAWTGEPAAGADGTAYIIPITFGDTLGLGEGMRFGCEPTPAKHHDTEVEPGQDPDGTPTKTYRPVADESFALDGFTLDGQKVFDRDMLVSERFELDGDTYWELDSAGGRTGNGFRVSLPDYVLTVVGFDPQVDFLTTPSRQIVLSVNDGESTGTLVADGSTVNGTKTIQVWKTRNELHLLMAPADGSALTSLGLSQDGGAYTEHVSEVQEAPVQMYGANSKSYMYTVPTEYLNGAKREVRVRVVYGVPGETPGPGEGDDKPGEGDDNPGGSSSSSSSAGSSSGSSSGSNSGNGSSSGNNAGGSSSSSGNAGSNGSGSGNGSGSNGAGSEGPISDGDTVGDGSAPNADGTYNIKVSVKGGNGEIEGDAERRVRPGADHTITFKPNVGFRVAAITLDGKRSAYTSKSYTIKNVQAGHTLQVEFEAIPYTGDNSDTAKTVRKLQSLAQTGDLNPPALLALATIACGALGIALLTGNRRRRPTHASSETE